MLGTSPLYVGFFWASGKKKGKINKNLKGGIICIQGYRGFHLGFGGRCHLKVLHSAGVDIHVSKSKDAHCLNGRMLPVLLLLVSWDVPYRALPTLSLMP